MSEAGSDFTDRPVRQPTEIAPRVVPDPGLTPDALDRLVFERGFPLTSPGVTTFAYQGKADSVRLIHFGVGLPEDLSFERLDRSSWWLLALALPDGTRLEYQLDIVEGGDHRVIEDPLNPFEARNPFGQNSVCRSHGYALSPWVRYDPMARAGSRRSLTVPSVALGRPVAVTLYLPDSFTIEPEHRYPFAILHDGSDYLHYASASTVLDNLIHRGLVPEMVVAFCDPHDRLREYGNDERHARFVVEELIPFLEAHLPLAAEREARCLGGASFGAVATLAAAARYPDAFGSLLLQSGSFAGSSPDSREPLDGTWAPVRAFVKDYVSTPVRVADKVFMSCGVFESLISDNRALRPILTATGMQVVSGEVLDGHTWGCWRDQLGVGLPWLFDGEGTLFERRDPTDIVPPTRPGGTYG